MLTCACYHSTLSPVFRAHHTNLSLAPSYKQIDVVVARPNLLLHCLLKCAHVHTRKLHLERVLVFESLELMHLPAENDLNAGTHSNGDAQVPGASAERAVRQTIWLQLQ